MLEAVGEAILRVLPVFPARFPVPDRLRRGIFPRRPAGERRIPVPPPNVCGWSRQTAGKTRSG
ncbi:hypothetical protein KCP73_13505 [Salmonella enterica subsp. enterica]|nr:hypothetical protein KCP73_13505 [Salmonella enterica subsp. enterica]